MKAEAKAQAPQAVDRVAALVGPKLDEIVDGFGARLLEFVAQAGDALARGIADVLDRALAERARVRHGDRAPSRTWPGSTPRSPTCGASRSTSRTSARRSGLRPRPPPRPDPAGG